MTWEKIKLWEYMIIYLPVQRKDVGENNNECVCTGDSESGADTGFSR